MCIPPFALYCIMEPVYLANYLLSDISFMKIQLETKSGDFFGMCVIYVKYIADLKTYYGTSLLIHLVNVNL
jgi:hypothetical protein